MGRDAFRTWLIAVTDTMYDIGRIFHGYVCLNAWWLAQWNMLSDRTSMFYVGKLRTDFDASSVLHICLADSEDSDSLLNRPTLD